MKAARQIVFGIFLATLLISNISAQNPSELGNIREGELGFGTRRWIPGISGSGSLFKGAVNPRRYSLS